MDSFLCIGDYYLFLQFFKLVSIQTFGWGKKMLEFCKPCISFREQNSSIHSYFRLIIDSSQGKWMQQSDYERKAGPTVGFY